MTRPLRAAVVGCGYWGPNIVRNLASTPGVEVACICDLDPARMDRIARTFRVGRTTTRFADVLEDPSIEALAIATPIGTHRELGEAALGAGKHLWVEKPLAATVAEAEALVRAARERERVLLVDHTFVYTPAVQAMQRMVRDGELGEPLYLDSVRVNLGLVQPDANVLWDLGPHDLSITRHVLGRRPAAVSAIGIRHIAGAGENMVYLTLRYDDRLIAHVHLNWLAPVKVRLMMLGGTRRMVVYDDLEPAEKLKVYDKGIDVSPPGDAEARQQTLISYRSGDLWSPALEQTEALSAAARDFRDAIRDRRTPVADGELGLDVVRCLAAGQRSLESGGGFVAIDGGASA